jgi:hypothetical protein
MVDFIEERFSGGFRRHRWGTNPECRLRWIGAVQMAFVAAFFKQIQRVGVRSADMAS